MANIRLPSSGGVHATLTSTTADRVDVPITNGPFSAEVFNRATTNAIWARGDGTVAVAAATGTSYIPAGTFRIVRVIEGGYLSVVGNGDAYSVDWAV